MANRTVKDANTVHGTNPQYLVEKIIRTRIYDSKYWKEECFAVTAELLVDKAMALKYIGGVHGGHIKPSPFLCLTLKMLQIQPEKDIIVEFIKQDDFKYLRALGSFYLRLVYPSLDCYKYLEPLLNDYRKLRLMDRNGLFHLTYMDQYIDNLLRDERYCDVILPRIQKRWVHEDSGELEARVSLLEDDLDDLESESDEEEEPIQSSPPVHSADYRSERSRRSPHGREKRRRSLSPSGDHKRRREKEGREGRRHNREGGRDRDRRDHHSGYGDGYGETRRAHHHSSTHHSHHGRGEYDYHTRDDYYGSRDDYHSNREGHHRSEDSHRSNREHRRDESRRGDKKESSSRSKREHKKKGGGDLDAEIEEANKLRAQLGLPPLK